MRRGQPLPRLWMMTDERQGDGLWRALFALPRGAGVIVRHYALAQADRRILFGRIKAIARRRNLIVVLAGRPALALAWGADGSHGPGNDLRHPRLRTTSVHSIAQMRAAERAGADALFLSPVFPTRSHPGTRALGIARFGLMARQARAPVVALGGMSIGSAARLRPLRIHGWAAIDAWSSVVV